MKRLTSVLLATAAFATGSSADQPLVWGGVPIRWPSFHAVLHLSLDSFPLGSSNEAAVLDAVRRWNDVPSRFSFSVARGDKSVGLGNGESEVWITTQSYLLSGALAMCVPLALPNGDYVEADVLFDASVPWAFGENKTTMFQYTSGGGGLSFRAVAIHELGHALGLDHEDATYNVMGDAGRCHSTNGSTARAYPGEDAGDGAINVYGAAATPSEDLGVVHWRRTGRMNGYSLHGRTNVFAEGGGVLTNDTPTAGEIFFEVSPGQTIDVEFNFENNGSTGQRPAVAYFLSSNSTITTGDIYLDQVQFPVSRNFPLLRKDTVTIPSSVQKGETWFLGVIVDPSDRILEWNETNNATYVQLLIVE